MVRSPAGGVFSDILITHKGRSRIMSLIQYAHRWFDSIRHLRPNDPGDLKPRERVRRLATLAAHHLASAGFVVACAGIATGVTLCAIAAAIVIAHFVLQLALAAIEALLALGAAVAITAVLYELFLLWKEHRMR